MRSLHSLVTAVATMMAVSALPANSLALATNTASARDSRMRRAQNLMSESIVEETLERRTSSSTNDDGYGKNKNDDLSKNISNLSPFLRGMVDEQREFQMNVGKAMDVLRKDYPYFLKRSPDYSIYHDSITLRASDGQVQISKLSSYRKAFGIIRTMFSLIYDIDRSVIQSRMVYDSTRSQIRVSFNARLVPKNLGVASLGLGFVVGGGVHRAVHVDGISVYSMDLSPTYYHAKDETGNLLRNDGAGKIIEHRIEKLLVNGAPLQPPYFKAFGLEMLSSGQHTGSLAGAGAWSFERL